MPAAVAEAGRVLRPGGRVCIAIPHPVNSAGGFAGSEPDATFVIGGSYLDAAATANVVERDGVRLTFHSEHRPLEAYSRALEDAGLLIEAIREVGVPGPARDDADGRWQRIPLYLHLRAVKPA
jgi:SAM-dependent methyltransferase